MKKILLIHTGGTIGSTIRNKIIDISDSIQSNLAAEFLEINSEIMFEERYPYKILSENMTPIHWIDLIASINASDFLTYDGIIVTHGSDTLPYSAAALSYQFADCPIPLALVCANKPLETPESNGYLNFNKTVSFICENPVGGVFVGYQNHDGIFSIHLGTRLLEADRVFDDFYSFGSDTLYSDRNGYNDKLIRILAKARKPFILKPLPTFSKDVFALKTYPGLDYQNLSFRVKPRAFLHTLYHSASANVSNTPFSLGEFICKNAECDHYLLSFKCTDGDLYISCTDLLSKGGIPLQNISAEAALVKMYFAYGKDDVHPIDYMHRQIYHEFIL